MKRSTVESWLNGAGDLETEVIEDCPVKGESIVVRGLPAAFSNRAQSQALKMTQTARGDSVGAVDTERMAVLQFAFGCVEPKVTEQQAEVIAQKWGPAFQRAVDAIERLSGTDKEAIRAAETRFPAGKPGENGGAVGTESPAGSAGRDVPSRAGTGAGDAGS